MKTAIIDLGTNTFNLLIVEGNTTIFKTKIAVKLGEDGITKGYIAEAPFQRGFDALKKHLQTIEAYQVDRTLAFATSAIRSASNGVNFVAKVKTELTAVRENIIAGDLTWEEAVKKHSTDDKTKGGNGIIFNESSGSMFWDMQEIDKQVFLGIKNLTIGEISQPTYMETQSGDYAYRLLKLIEQTEPHKANMDDDYQMIQTYALSSKQFDEITEWVNTKVVNTHIKINTDYNQCEFKYDWIKIP